jgi:hypothetical protein
MKRLFLLLLSVSLAASVSWGAEPHVFMGLNWVTGEVIRGTGVPGTVPLSGRTAVLYISTSDPLTGTLKVTTTTDASGQFVLNPFYNRDVPLTFEVNSYAAAIMRGSDGYGANPVNFSLNTLGYRYVQLPLEYGAGPGTYEVVDTGWIRQTTITRVGNDLRLDWGYDPARGATAVKIYARAAAGSEYAADAATFTEVAAVLSGTTTYLHAGAAADGQNRYYRIVPDPLPAGTTVLSENNNSITAGKVEIALLANKYVFCAIPFMEDNVSLASTIGDQLPNNSRFLWWSGSGYDGAIYTTSTAPAQWTGTDRTLRMGEGFILFSPVADSVALVGRFGRLTTPFVKELPGARYSLIAYPYPTAKEAVDMGIVPDNQTRLIKWYVFVSADRQQFYNGLIYNGTYPAGTWTGDDLGITSFELATPRYYHPAASYSWEVRFP